MRTGSSQEGQALEVLADECQSGVGGLIAGQLFDDEVGHVEGTYKANSAWRAKCLVLKEKTAFLHLCSRIQVGRHVEIPDDYS
jgi:hypothetical protein